VVTHRDALLGGVARLLWGPSLVVAVSLIVKGYTDVGDGFAAGVVVALGISLSDLALGPEGAERVLPFLRHSPLFLVGGLALALTAGFFPLALGEPLFSHHPAPGADVVHIGSLELFTPLLFDLGVFLLVVDVLSVLLRQLATVDPDAGSEADEPPDDGASGRVHVGRAL
jgi:multicomponent Na+:H+ antiporter subunit B